MQAAQAVATHPLAGLPVLAGTGTGICTGSCLMISTPQRCAIVQATKEDKPEAQKQSVALAVVCSLSFTRDLAFDGRTMQGSWSSMGLDPFNCANIENKTQGGSSGVRCRPACQRLFTKAEGNNCPPSSKASGL